MIAYHSNYKCGMWGTFHISSYYDKQKILFIIVTYI